MATTTRPSVTPQPCHTAAARAARALRSTLTTDAALTAMLPALAPLASKKVVIDAGDGGVSLDATGAAPALAAAVAVAVSGLRASHPDAPVATHACLDAVEAAMSWGSGRAGRATAAARLASELAAPLLAIAVDALGDASVVNHALATLTNLASKSLVAAAVTAREPAFAALLGRLMPSCGEFAVQIEAAALLVAAVKGGVHLEAGAGPAETLANDLASLAPTKGDALEAGIRAALTKYNAAAETG